MLSKRKKYSILVVDDEPLIRKSLFETLKIQGFNVQMAATAEEALQLISQSSFDIIVTDMKLPKQSGIDLLRAVKRHHPQIEFVVMTGYGSIETAIEAIRLKAFDYITKPIVDDEIKLILDKIVEKRELLEENQNLKKLVAKSQRSSYHGMIGATEEMMGIYNLIDSVAGTNATILISGESGTGKGVVARAIHLADQNRSKMPFMEVSCGALSETLLESELFGHAQGSFTGAIKEKKGRFEAANGGTIFLDEIDTCSPALQVKLLRILQDGTFERVGDNTTQKTTARVIVASNRNLTQLVDEGKFREDLFYRIHVIPITLPPLRDRKGDIDALVKSFIEVFNAKNNKNVTDIDHEVRRLFMDYSWPGNIRQLENVIEGALILAKGTVITRGDIPKSFNARESKDQAVPTSKILKDSMRDPEKEMILAALKEAKYNRSKAAVQLGINRTTLYNKMKKHGIET